MNYWDEMRTKWGFNDGSSYPPDVEQAREVYIKAVNFFAEKLGSGLRAYAYDRAGVHNYCLIMFAPKDFDMSDEKGLRELPEMEPDDAMYDAVMQASELGVDGWIETTVVVDHKGLDAALQSA